MAYNPGITYQGGEMWNNALSRFGGAIADSLNKTEDLRRQQALNDPIMQHALATGRIDQDTYNKYLQAPFTTKASMANGVIANIHDDWQRQINAQDEADKQAQRDLQLQVAQMQIEAGRYGLKSSDMAQQPVWGPDGKQIGIYDERGTPHFFPQGAGQDGDGGIVVDKDTLPGAAIVSKKGSGQFQLFPLSPGSVKQDPSGTFYFGGKFGTEPKAMPSAVIDARTLQNLTNPGAAANTAAVQAPAPTAAPPAPSAPSALGPNERVGFTKDGQQAVWDVTDPNNPVFKRYAQ
jgi:hypothetical protein